MPFESIVFVSGVVTAFLIFGAVLFTTSMRAR